MGILDPIEIKYNDRHDFFYVGQGRETFYRDEDRSLIYFDDPHDCLTWMFESFGGGEVGEMIEGIIKRPKNKEVVEYAMELAKTGHTLDVDDLYNKFGRGLVERSFEVQVIVDYVNDMDFNPLAGLPLFAEVKA